MFWKTGPSFPCKQGGCGRRSAGDALRRGGASPAEPSQAEPSRAEPNRAEQNRAEPSRAEPRLRASSPRDPRPRQDLARLRKPDREGNRQRKGRSRRGAQGCRGTAPKNLTPCPSPPRVSPRSWGSLSARTARVSRQARSEPTRPGALLPLPFALGTRSRFRPRPRHLPLPARGRPHLREDRDRDFAELPHARPPSLPVQDRSRSRSRPGLPASAGPRHGYPDPSPGQRTLPRPRLSERRRARPGFCHFAPCPLSPR